MLEQIFDWLLQWSGVISGLGSLLVSGGLLLLYCQQKQLLRQNHITSNRAYLSVDHFWFEDDGIFVDLSNSGNGLAKDLELVCVSIITDSDGGVKYGTEVSPFQRLGLPEDLSINENESEVAVKSRPRFSALQDSDTTSWAGLQRQLDSEKYPTARLHFFIRYSDLTEKRWINHLASVEFSVEKMDGFSDTMENGGRMILGLPSPDAETLKYDKSGVETDSKRTVK